MIGKVPHPSQVTVECTATYKLISGSVTFPSIAFLTLLIMHGKS